MDPNNKYTKMQQSQYDNEAVHWNITNKDAVVGSFDKHNLWQDYDNFLFKGIETTDKTALDFGCGPGRNIVKFANRFSQIDGADISDVNLEKARVWFAENKLEKVPVLFKNNGIDLGGISSNIYDVVFSTICLQHICVHDIRFSLMKEFHRVLKNDGVICIQMGLGTGHPRTVGYYDNYYDAQHTNSGYDTRVDSPDELRDDLKKIGFTNFEYDIRPVGPGDAHENWIFFRAIK